MRAERRSLILLAAVALLLAALMHVTGVSDFVFYGGPVVLIGGLLLSGRYVGEDWIVARRAPASPRRRPARRSWARFRDRALATLLERSPRLERGPPAHSAA